MSARYEHNAWIHNATLKIFGKRKRVSEHKVAAVEETIKMNTQSRTEMEKIQQHQQQLSETNPRSSEIIFHGNKSKPEKKVNETKIKMK